MFGYYLGLAWRSLRRHWVLAGLMVIAIALGIGASITMLTVLHNMAGNPLPGKSAVLFHPQIDPRPLNLPGASRQPPDDLTYTDAVNLYHLGLAPKRVLTSANWLPTRKDAPHRPLQMVTVRAATADFFSMFNVPFLYGSPWSTQKADGHVHEVVLTRRLNNKLFGGANSVGKQLVIATQVFRVAGVIGKWNPQPHFYDLDQGPYGPSRELFMPFFTWLNLPQDYGYGPMQCWGDNPRAGLHDPKAPQCTWVQFWVQLDTPAQVAAYHQALVHYSLEQKKLGRFQRAPNVRLHNLVGWLNYKQVIPSVVRMQTWIAFAVLLICMVNTVGLLVAKFVRKSGEIGVRRALGASRRSIFWQCLIEAGLVGLAGGLIGLPLTWLGLWIVRQQPVSFAASTHLDVSMLGVAIALAVVATLAAGIWPAWRAAHVAPALQVKSL